MTGGHEPLIVIVSRSGSRLFDARLAGEAEALCKNSRTPLLAAARVLIGRGHDPSRTVVMRHAGSATDCLIFTLGAAAALTVDESGTPRFRPWRAYPAAAVAGVRAECVEDGEENASGEPPSRAGRPKPRGAGVSAMKDLLGGEPYRPNSYPDVPGYRRPGPSQEAAQRIASHAKATGLRILDLLRRRPDGMTADEIADALEMPNNYMARPRIAELHRQGEVVASGDRRPGKSGIAITVWKLAPPLPNERAKA